MSRVLLILETLADSSAGRSAAELATVLGVHKTTLYRYLRTLEEMGYVRLSSRSLYSLDTRVLEIASRVLARMPFRNAAHPFLLKLGMDTGKTVHLCVLDGHEVVYIDKIEGQKSLPVLSRIGSRTDGWCTAAGKALLSSLPTDQIIELLRRAPPARRTPSTLTDPFELLEELKACAKRGYATDNQEHEVGIACLGTVVRGFGGDVAGAVSVTSLAQDFENSETFDALLCSLRTAVTAIEGALGFKWG